jgi:inosine-uridine nucleoside N-ribohydrolase
MPKFHSRTWAVFAFAAFCCQFLGAPPGRPQAANSGDKRVRIILDTDIGDDIDDAFALALALRSPEIEIAGITTAWGDTRLRARLAQRFLQLDHARPTPVVSGLTTASKTAFSQARWAEAGPPFTGPKDAVRFLLEQARKSPGEITLVAIGPLTNLGAAIAKDAETFRKFKRVVLMGGSIRRGYGDPAYPSDLEPQPEYNIYSDVAAAQKLFSSGVPIFMMPLDSTQLMLDEANRNLLFRTGTAMTDSLSALYDQWVEQNRKPTATLFDVMAVAYVARPELCPVTEFRIRVDALGFTRPEPGKPNAAVCLQSDSERFFHFLLPRLTAPATKPAGQSNSRPLF